MNRLALVLLVVCLLLPASGVQAQCVIGVFADPVGVQSVYWPIQFVPFDFYIVMWDEATVEGVAYRLVTPPDLVVTQSWFSPDGVGFEFVTPGGSIIGFGECAIGFGGTRILVARYQGLWTSATNLPSIVSIEANVDEHPTDIVYATCSGQIEPCPNPMELYLTYGAPVESRSFGAVKSLF